MPDFIDQTQDREEALLGFQLQAARQKAGKRELEPTGKCHWCEEIVDRPKLFCDRACADDHGRYGKQGGEAC